MSNILRFVGFSSPAMIDIALGIAYAESEGYADAVGDTTIVDEKWGPSIGLFQIRTLRHPLDFAVEDRCRYAWALLNATYNASSALVLSKQGIDWSKWSTFRNGSYKKYLGKDFTVKFGHKNAKLWRL